MIKINENFLKMQDSYLFSTIAKKVAKYQEEHPDKKIIKLGIGDVTKPLVPKVLEQMKKAVEEEGASNTFRGYGPEQGYDFLRNAIVKYDYEKRGVKIEPDEVFVSDGAKCDCGNIVDLFDVDNKVAITDPVYPVYLDTNIMSGRTGKYNEETGKYEGIIYIPCTAENNFTPELPKEVPDMIYLCFPNNPTGTVISKEELAKWVKYAKENNIPILGVCLGMQEMSAFLLGEEKDITKKILNHNGSEHLVSIKRNSFLYDIIKKQEIFVNSRHNDYIPKLSSLYVSARSLDNCIEAIELKNHPFFLGLQWHPESLYETDESSRRIFNTFLNEFLP